ncbi:MAG: alpha/beta hydrolase [Anaerolineae bacterium]|nr:alpha/beta hydrolase [Anaerolineae bacterium]
MSATDRFITLNNSTELTLHIREWPGEKRPFVLVHGLASNARTWEAVAEHLADAGHHVITLDQRGHGLSDKPDEGYDFATITGDLAQLLDALQLDHPILAGQSWGGNVMLEFGVRYPGRACGLAFVDGGYLDLRSRPDPTWEKISAELRPPDLIGTPRASLKQKMQEFHPDWSEMGIEATLANFETLPDGTIRPWLTLERHLKILRALWEQTPTTLYANITEPVLICAAEDAKNPEWMKVKAKQVNAAHTQIARVEVHWFENTDHDIHVQKPIRLADLFLDALAHGIWADCG